MGSRCAAGLVLGLLRWAPLAVLLPTLAIAQSAPAAKLNQLEGLELKPDGTVALRFARKPNFTTLQLHAPERLVLDFADTVLADGVSDPAGGAPGLTRVKTERFRSETGSLARVVLFLEPETDTQVLPTTTGSLLVKVVTLGPPPAVGRPPLVAAATPKATPAVAARPDPAAQASVDAERKLREDAERRVKEAEARMATLEAERRAAVDRAAQADERAQKEAAEKAALEQQRKAADEQAERSRLAAAEVERKALQEAERKAKQAEEERATALAARQAAEEKATAERKAREAADEARQVAEKKVRAEQEARALAEARQKEEAAEAERVKKASLAMQEAQQAERDRLASLEVRNRAQAEQEREQVRRREQALQEAARAERDRTEAQARSRPDPVHAEHPVAALPHGSVAPQDAAIRGGTKDVSLIGYRPLAGGAGRVFVKASEPVRFSVVATGPRSLVVELENARIGQRNTARPLDTSFFPGAVAYVAATEDRAARSVKVEIRLKASAPYQARLDGTDVVIDFPPLDE